MVRFAVAVHLPADVLERVRAFPRPAAPGVQWARPEQWIVRVRPLGHVDPALAGPLLDALAAELDGAPPARCVLGPATVRLAGQWLAAPVTGLEDVGAAVFDATAELVPVTHPQPFRTDLVLARGRAPRELAGQPLAAEWTARELVLVADRSAPGRPRLEDVGAVPLDG
ncbi:MAG: hypothetical protein NTW05_25725 [Pseudonocardiales bacterium]|nr:hypothetical protein [Pseudonocardiales bacterium]